MSSALQKSEMDALTNKTVHDLWTDDLDQFCILLDVSSLHRFLPSMDNTVVLCKTTIELCFNGYFIHFAYICL